MTDSTNIGTRKKLWMRLVAMAAGVLLLLLCTLIASYCVARKTAIDIARESRYTEGIECRLTFDEVLVGSTDPIPTKVGTYVLPRWLFRWRIGDGMVIYEVVSLLGVQETSYFKLENTDDLGPASPKPEILFKEHVAYVRNIPVPDPENPTMAKGVFEDDAARHFVGLCSPEGIALLCKKAREGTVEERVIATRQYSWYTVLGVKAEGSTQYFGMPWTSALCFRSAQLTDHKMMLEFLDELKSLDIPPNMKYIYEDAELNVNVTLGELAKRSGLDQPTGQPETHETKGRNANK